MEGKFRDSNAPIKCQQLPNMQGYNCIMVINQENNKLLFCKRTKDPYKGLFNLVGGKIENGENGFEAAYRELFEETGINSDDIELHHMMDFTYYNQACYVEVYVGYLNRKVTLIEEAHPLVWINMNDNFFECDKYAGEGNIGHMVEQVKRYDIKSSVADTIKASKYRLGNDSICIGVEGEGSAMTDQNITTLDYYNKNAESFYNNTVQVSFAGIQNNFLKYLPSGAYILDFGCGSGRDSKAFLDQGYKVDAIDGSIELCRLAEALIRQKVSCIRFQEFVEVNKYDGIWACASILHLEWQELIQVMSKLKDALKPDGCLYTSFKYGDFSGMRNGRYFTDMTEDRFDELLKLVGSFDIIETQITGDVRLGRESEPWINLILKKTI